MESFRYVAQFFHAKDVLARQPLLFLRCLRHVIHLAYLHCKVFCRLLVRERTDFLHRPRCFDGCEDGLVVERHGKLDTCIGIVLHTLDGLPGRALREVTAEQCAGRDIDRTFQIVRELDDAVDHGQEA